MPSVSISALMEFFDVDLSASSHSSAIKGLFAEELLLALLRIRLSEEYRVRPEDIQHEPTCTTGKTTGPRLDAWMIVPNKIAFQVEVKSWSEQGYGGKQQDWYARGEEEICDYRKKKWTQLWDDDNSCFKSGPLKKVLTPMSIRSDSGFSAYQETGKIAPLACLWTPVHQSGKNESLFTVELPEASHFQKLHVFSGATFLQQRSSQDRFDLELPRFEARIKYLRKIFPDGLML